MSAENKDKPLALITGASKGIGKYIALELAQKGYDLALVARGQDRLNEIVKQCEALGVRAVGFSQDMSQTREIKALVEKVYEAFGKIDVLVNNAGQSVARSLLDADMELWDQTLDLNFRAYLHLTKYVGKIMQKQKTGFVINISSEAANLHYKGGSIYCTTKVAVSRLSKILYWELREKNIRVCNIEPGLVATEMKGTMTDKIDREKCIQPEDLAKTVSFVLSMPKTTCITNINVMPSTTPYL